MQLFQLMDILCPVLCFAFCLVHSIISSIQSHKLNKRILALCERCGAPVVEGERHECPELTSDQLSALVEFVNSMYVRS